jgi:hypothetical protein
MNNIQKLRIYAMLMRLQEIERERLRNVFFPEPNKIQFRPKLLEFTQLYDKKQWYDKKGKPFDLPKSKYHK